MIVYEKFDVEIARSVSANNLHWPTRGEASDEGSLGGNRSYLDLRDFTWAEAARLYEKEAQLIERLEAAADLDAEYELIEDELYEDDEGLFGLDIGVASAVLALSAAGCIPCSSCNGGAYGGSHNELYPVVGFYAKARQIDLLLRCAEEAAVGMEHGPQGAVIVYADDIRRMPVFANTLISRSAEFREVARMGTRQRATKKVMTDASVEENGQLRLPLD